MTTEEKLKELETLCKETGGIISEAINEVRNSETKNDLTNLHKKCVKLLTNIKLLKSK